jgi:hypothetical protein
MKSIKYIALSFGVTALALTSCSDSFLDHVPDERTEIDTEGKVVQLLISAYPASNPSWLGEISSDNLIDNQAPHLPTSPNDKQILSHYNYSHYALWDNQAYRFEPTTNASFNDDDSPGQLWQSYYNSVATANYALQAIDKIGGTDVNALSSTLKAARSEALLLRAYDHFMLVNLFSKAFKDSVASKADVGIPYVTEIEDVVSKNYDRGTVAADYKKIGEDLEAGLATLSDINYTTAPKYHFNSNAAHAFAARYYLFTHQWQKVIDHADAVLGTDSAKLQSMMMNYSVFEKCSTSSDFAVAWQNPSLNNNLMLLDSYSTISRRCFGYRYSCAGPAARATLMVHNSPLWSSYICPAQAIVGGMIFGNSSHDYGYFNTKIGEQFQYTDKVAGIGYAHVIYRAFTANELLLERAEAKIMLGRYDEAADDLMAYWNYTLKSFSTKDYTSYIKAGYTKLLTKSTLLSYWGSDKNTNCYSNWDFTQQMSSSYVIPSAAVPYMNCLNDFRRFENAFEGMRFFDIKRWGLPLTHVVGINEEKITTSATDDLRAVEVPWETMSAGMSSSRSTVTRVTPDASLNLNNLRVKY